MDIRVTNWPYSGKSILLKRVACTHVYLSVTVPEVDGHIHSIQVRSEYVKMT